MSINKKGNHPVSPEAKQDDTKKNRQGKQPVASLVNQITEILAIIGKHSSASEAKQDDINKIGKENSQ